MLVWLDNVMPAVSLTQPRRIRSTLSLLIVLSVLSASGANAEIIDDSDPRANWINAVALSGWNTQDCPPTQCSAKPPGIPLIYNGTWHDTSIEEGNPPAFLNLTFFGTGVSVFGIHLSTAEPEPPWKNQNLTFTIDGAFVNDYVYNPTRSDWAYNVSFLSITGLPYDRHNLFMTVNPNSTVLIDYFDVTDDPPSTTSLPPVVQTDTLTVDGTPTVVTIILPPRPSSLTGTSFPSIAGGPTPTPSSSLNGTASTSSRRTLSSGQRLGLILGLVLGIVALLLLLIACIWKGKRHRWRQPQVHSEQMATAWTIDSGADLDIRSSTNSPPPNPARPSHRRPKTLTMSSSSTQSRSPPVSMTPPQPQVSTGNVILSDDAPVNPNEDPPVYSPRGS